MTQCEVGNHLIAKGEDHHRCYHCNRSVCMAHIGNPDALPGDLIACADHMEEVGREENRLRDLRQGVQKASLPLQAVSNVIELKPDGKYLLVFKGEFTQNQLARARDMIRAQGIEQIVAISLHGGQELEVIEVPGVEKGTPKG